MGNTPYTKWLENDLKFERERKRRSATSTGLTPDERGVLRDDKGNSQTFTVLSSGLTMERSSLTPEQIAMLKKLK